MTFRREHPHCLDRSRKRYGDHRVKIQFSARASRLRDDRLLHAFLICDRSGGTYETDSP